MTFPWPPADLSPNSRKHWRAKAKASKAYREQCRLIAKFNKISVDWDGLIHVQIEFQQPNRRHMDDDNMVAAFKSGRDGLADAMRVNDRRFRIHPFISETVVPGGAVVVTLSQSIEDMA